MLSGLSVCMLAIYYFFDVDLQTALLLPSGSAILLYIIGSAAGIRLLHDRGLKRMLPWISLVMSAIILPFVGILVLVSFLTAVLAFFYVRLRNPLRSGESRNSIE